MWWNVQFWNPPQKILFGDCGDWGVGCPIPMGSIPRMAIALSSSDTHQTQTYQRAGPPSKEFILTGRWGKTARSKQDMSDMVLSSWEVPRFWCVWIFSSTSLPRFTRNKIILFKGIREIISNPKKAKQPLSAATYQDLGFCLRWRHTLGRMLHHAMAKLLRLESYGSNFGDLARWRLTQHWYLLFPLYLYLAVSFTFSIDLDATCISIQRILFHACR